MAVVLAAPAAVAAGLAERDQLAEVRSRVEALERRVAELDTARQTVGEERDGLRAELALAEARVHENELVLARTRDQIVLLRTGLEGMNHELEQRRLLLRKHLEMMALLGRPGPLQLLWDAARGGELEESLGTVRVLTAGHIRLTQEFERLRSERNERLAVLSLAFDRAEVEAEQLVARRRELEATRKRVETRLQNLERSRVAATGELEEMRERERALERLLDLVATRQRMTGAERITSYRGALPWPVSGTVARRFGRQYLPTYATYTVCNGLRLRAAGGVPVRAVFPGVVAYARHFKGYGNMVVLDHGEGAYSLVGGLATIHVRLDQRVEMGTRLGLASPPDGEGNIYFEIRIDGEPQDPRRWLRLEPGSD